MRDAAGVGLSMHASTSPTQKPLHARSALRRHALRLPLLVLIASMVAADQHPSCDAICIALTSARRSPSDCFRSYANSLLISCLFQAAILQYGPYTGLVDTREEVDNKPLADREGV